MYVLHTVLQYVQYILFSVHQGEGYSDMYNNGQLESVLYITEQGMTTNGRKIKETKINVGKCRIKFIIGWEYDLPKKALGGIYKDKQMLQLEVTPTSVPALTSTTKHLKFLVVLAEAC